MKYFLFLLLFFTGICEANTATDIYAFPTEQQQTQFYTLTHELRCLVCQNETLSDSNAGLAKDLRKEIAQMILLGKSNQDIIHYLVNRYGDFVLYQPPLSANTYILWFAPLALLIIGILIAGCVIFNRHRHARELS